MKGYELQARTSVMLFIYSSSLSWMDLRVKSKGKVAAKSGGCKTQKPQRFCKVGVFDDGLAATYSPACDSSTIGATGLNCSVRNGKR